MTGKSPYWHIDTIPEIVRLAQRELAGKTEERVQVALQHLKLVNRLGPFLDKLTVLYLQELIVTGEHISSSQLRDKWLAWADSDEAVHERWYSPIARAAIGSLDVVAPHVVTMAARDIMPYAEVHLSSEPTDAAGEFTYMRPEVLHRDTVRTYSQM